MTTAMASVLRYSRHDGIIPFLEDLDAIATGPNSAPKYKPRPYDDNEYRLEELPFQPLGKYVVCIKCNCHGDMFIEGCFYNAYKCECEVWMLETDNGTYMWVEKSNFEIVSVFKNVDC